MNDMSKVIVAKSDQVNSDDLMAGPKTITITRVEIRDSTEQPVSIYFEGDGNKPWKPCKSTARVLVHFWGPDANQYVGRSVTIFRDPSVKWGGLEVGGIRISHMSHISRETSIPLTMTRGVKKMSTIKPLVLDRQDAPKQQQATQTAQTPTKPLSERLTSFKAYLLARPDSTAMQTAYVSKAAKDLFAEVDKADPDVIGTNLQDLDRWVQDQISERQADEKAKTEAPTTPADEPDFT